MKKKSKREKQCKKSQRDSCNIIKETNTPIKEIPKEERKKGAEKSFAEIMAKKY